MPAGGSKGGTDDLLSVLLQQREADEHSDGEEAPHHFQEAHHAEDGEDSDEEVAVEDPEAQKAEDADVQAQLRSANEVWHKLVFTGIRAHMYTPSHCKLECLESYCRWPCH